jgi:hypothetical protein
MSIPVDLDELAAAMTDYPTAFLITVNDDLRVHAVQVHPSLEDGALRIAEPGRRTSANLAVRPDVTVLFPPHEPGGYTLLVDGRADLASGEESGGGGRTAVVPTAAVLHRAATQPAVDPSDPDACVNDCVPLDHRHG